MEKCEMTNSFVNAVRNQSARTENGMKAHASTGGACVDLFYKIGASRGKDIIPAFTAAYVENPEVAVRIALWARDVRGGAGERKLFRDILNHLSVNDVDSANRVLVRIPELGRYDDLLEIENETVQRNAYELIKQALNSGNGLAAKWLPRKGKTAVQLRNFLGMSPKRYRKTLVNLTKVVESQMCAKDWDNINFNHVPSVASSRYKKAFARHTPEKYTEWTTALVSKDPEVAKTVKVNAGAVYPYDVLKGVVNQARYGRSTDNLNHVIAQWDALPNYVGDANILPLVDVSGSMICPAGGYASKSTVTCLDVAVSLGLYLSDKNTGKFKDTFLTFSGNPQLVNLQGNIVQKIQQMIKSEWGMNTNLHLAIHKILDVAVENSVPQEEMPQMLLILSDMQFDACARYDDSAMEMIARKYEERGYRMPAIVFWNLNAAENSPAKKNQSRVALVSGFSPAIVKAVLTADVEQFTPEGIMNSTIMSDRYNF
jgi:hypothetical protein